MDLNKTSVLRGLTAAQEEQIVRDGFVKLEDAFPQSLATECREILWVESGCRADDRSTWTRPVVRVGDCAQEPFRNAANTPALHAAFDQLVGVGRWMPRQSLGGFPIRFPHSDDPGDTGWHVDASFPPEAPAESIFDWRINVESKGRALLMLFLFSDVSEDDAPTRMRIGSHLPVARLLAPAGSAGMSFMELAQELERVSGGAQEATATGPAGTVYLCHPFLVHAAQRMRGTAPRFMAQPPLYPRVPFNLSRSEGDYSLVEKAILLAME